MTTLALEFSSEVRSCALQRSPGGEVYSSQVTGQRHTPALKLIAQTLEKAGMRSGDIRRVVVGLGPGSYTGIRIALSVAQGLHLALGCELVGISSLFVMAADICKSGRSSPFAAVVDAQRNEFYFSAYDVVNSRLTEIVPLEIVTSEELKRKAARFEPLFAPEPLPRAPLLVEVKPPTAAAMLEAVDLDSAVLYRPPFVEPLYLRAPNFVKSGSPLRHDLL
jgi:tRNA threonylcarbamoyladenosine biosynthesis protein TsaB